MAQIAASYFPAPIDSQKLPCVHHLGFHSADSFGAAAYLVSGADLTVMVDSPRYNSRLARRIEAEYGGVDLMLLTHMDDVADHNRWKERFPSMTRVMHTLDVRGPECWPGIDMRAVETQLEGNGPWELAPGLTAVHTPGHSRGHLCFQLDGAHTGGCLLYTSPSPRDS